MDGQGKSSGRIRKKTKLISTVTSQETASNLKNSDNKTKITIYLGIQSVNTKRNTIPQWTESDVSTEEESEWKIIT